VSKDDTHKTRMDLQDQTHDEIEKTCGEENAP